MSFEAVAWVRKNFLSDKFEREQKWLTVPTNDVGEAIKAFQALGFDVRGLSILTQEEATAQAERIGVI